MEIVTFVFPDKTGTRTGVCHLQWRKGMQVQQYLHEPALRQEGLIARWTRCSHWNKKGEKIRITYQPTPGDVIVLSKPIQAMS